MSSTILPEPDRQPQKPVQPPTPDEKPDVKPKAPEVKPDYDPDIPEHPGPPLSDPESPHGG